MQYIQQKLQQLSTQLLKPRKYNYSQDTLYSYLQQNPSIKYQQIGIKNKRAQNLDTIIFKPTYSDTCLLYAHGLGSNKMEVLPLLENFRGTGFHVCAWDFSASGRSQGEYTTYGVREQDDVNAVLAYLDATRQYSRYILWGRSMGGASIILSQSRNINKKVHCIILDSPFSCFQRAALQIASHTTKIPQLMLTLLLQPLKTHLQSQHPSINPFQLNILQAASHLQSRVMLIYSRNDSIVHYTHSKQISKWCARNVVEVQIQEDHNRTRGRRLYEKAIQFVKQSFLLVEGREEGRRRRSGSRGISLAKKENWRGNQSQCRNPRKSISISSSITNDKINMSHSNTTTTSTTTTSTSLQTTQKLLNIGTFTSMSSHEMMRQGAHKQVYIRSVALEGRGDHIRNSIRYGGKTRNFQKLL